jgi:tRNA-specific 2-thiouridylase
MKKRVLVGVSGGVDSGVTAYLLKRQGYEVIGVYLKMHKGVDHASNLRRVEELAQQVGFPFFVEDVTELFEQEVYNYFVESYRKGVTPNPCAMCNIKVKFGILEELMKKYGAELAATGHYVRTDGQFLYEAVDKKKDQSYFLFGIEKKLLPRLLFPLGELTKKEVKKIADQAGLKQLVSQRESQDICFIETTYLDILRLHFNPDRPGGVYNRYGKKVGVHKGYPHYTIGQRRGFKLFKAHHPHYVVAIDPIKNRLIVGGKEELQKRRLFLKGVNLFVEEKEFWGEVKVRYRAPKVKGFIKMESRSKGVVFLQEPAVAVAKGQAAVFYEGEKVLGGGWIRGAE